MTLNEYRAVEAYIEAKAAKAKVRSHRMDVWFWSIGAIVFAIWCIADPTLGTLALVGCYAACTGLSIWGGRISRRLLNHYEDVRKECGPVEIEGYPWMARPINKPWVDEEDP